MENSDFIGWYSNKCSFPWPDSPFIDACLSESIRLYGVSKINDEDFSSIFIAESRLKMIAVLLAAHLKLLVELRAKISKLSFAGYDMPNDSHHKTLFLHLADQLNVLSQ